MVNHKAILSDLIECKLTQGEIALKHGCALVTVVRIAKQNHLQRGRGRKAKHIWRFKYSSEALAYLIGVYITDGHLAYSHRDHVTRQFVISNTDIEIVLHSAKCLEVVGLLSSQECTTRDKRKPIHKISNYSSDFAAWIDNECGYKSHIPAFPFNSPLSHKLAFLAGIIDGDGHVTKMGAIRIRGIDMWLSELPTLLQSMNIRTTGFRPTTATNADTPYYIVSINRSDFRALGGWCIAHEKMERIQTAIDSRGYRGQPPKHACSVCGEMKVSKNHEMCRECYLKSDKFHQHLKDIAPLGSKAGNSKRWNKPA